MYWGAAARGHASKGNSTSGLSDTGTGASGGSGSSHSGHGKKTKDEMLFADTAGTVRKAKDVLRKSALANTDSIIERKIIKETLVESKRRWANCMMLPIMWFFFIFYALAASMLEDPQQRHLVESPIRTALMPMLEEFEQPDATMLQGITSLPEVWQFLDQTYMPLFFEQKDGLGHPLPREKWGTMFQYNQVLGVVKLEQQRSKEISCADIKAGTSSLFGMMGGDEAPKTSHLKCNPVGLVSTEDFGLPWDKVDNVGSLTAKEYYLQANRTGPGEEPILECEDEGFTIQGCDSSRRLAYLREDASWFTGIMAPVGKDNPAFTMVLDSQDPYSKIQARSQYLQQREWLDKSSTAMQMTALYVNTDLDQNAPWIIQVTVEFQFSRGGGVFTFLDMHSFSTSLWGSGWNAMTFSSLFVVCLIISTISVFQQARTAKKERDWKFMINGANGITLFSVILGWLSIALYVIKMNRLASMEEAVQAYLDSRGSADSTAALKLHQSAQDVVDLIGGLRSFIAWATLVFNLRAFVSLQFQPRLAVVIRTLIESSSDMLHFMIIMLSTVVAFALSGMVMYGKRLQDFATPWAALMYCFKIMIENEFKLQELSADKTTYYPSWLWIGFYLCIGVVLLLNMVLAIIMDVYQEVRQESGNSMTMLADAVYLYRKFIYRKLWISERTIISALNDLPAYVTLDDLCARFPEMHQYQLDYIMSNCVNKAKIISRVGIDPGQTAEMVAAIHISLEEVMKDLAAMKKCGWMCKGLEVENETDREHIKDILTSVAVQAHWMNLTNEHISTLKDQVIGSGRAAKDTHTPDGVVDGRAGSLDGRSTTSRETM
jgi:hypothetical protein